MSEIISSERALNIHTVKVLFETSFYGMTFYHPAFKVRRECNMSIVDVNDCAGKFNVAAQRRQELSTVAYFRVMYSSGYPAACLIGES